VVGREDAAMICTVAEFTSMWKAESEITQRVLDALTNTSLGQRITGRDRTLGDLAWHLATTIGEMLRQTGLPVSGPDHDSPAPGDAKAIADAYRDGAGSVLALVGGRWTDATLAVEDEMYGERWTRGATLTALVCHEIHHRGQLSVLMRQAGLVVPSIYGPNREQTAQMHKG
jgi:uncharacterized damage-inducible protein DinB